MTCNSAVAGNWKQFPFAPNSWIYFNSATGLPDFTQPVQGSAFPDCTFVSALIALTWVNKDYIINKIGTGQFSSSYTFWDGGTQVPVKINNTLLVDPAGTFNRCGAVSKNYYELWPSFIEKAYAKFCQYKNIGGIYDLTWLNTAANNPDRMSSMTREQWGGNPTTALAYLTGCTKVDVKVPNAVPKCGVTAPASHYDYIKKCLCTDAAGVNVRRTKYPAVAWTYGSGAQFNNTCGIFANHCYALLGIVEYNASQYIVLRDTFSVDPAGCHQISDTAPWTSMDSEYDICKKFKVPPVPHASNTWKTWDFTNKSDAVFGLSEADFTLYFEWYGYVN
jgi:hypothetical protein